MTHEIHESHNVFFRLYKALLRLFGYYNHDEVSFGWERDPRDDRDYGVNHPQIKPILDQLRKNSTNNMKLEKFDLSQYFPASYDQGATGSCTAQAASGAVRYLIKMLVGKDFEPSRAFIYKTMRNLLNLNDGNHSDRGGFNRLSLKALVVNGVLPEMFWPFDNLSEEPRGWHYSIAQNFQVLRYFRLDDDVQMKREELLDRVKEQLLIKIPVIFGFRVYTSVDQARRTGDIPYPSFLDRLRGGHAVLIVGYDDNREIVHRGTGEKTIGAIKIYNSWGDWGDNGFGYMPYDYILKKKSWDFWCVLTSEWLDLTPFNPNK